ncbi:hypothetical protein N866_15500, partial [Actinotalea ferrariae CF5-4]
GLHRHGLTAPLLGRGPELARLLDLVGPARPGTPAVGGALVLAPPGTGKTRLVTELAGLLGAAGRPCWTVRVGLAPGRGYDVLADLLAAAGLDREDPAPGRGGELVRALLAGDRLDAAPADLYAAWTSLLDAVAPDAVWVVEDLHLAGPDLRAFLHHALAHPSGTAGTPGTPGAAGTAGRRVVLTARPGPLGPDALAGSPHVAVLALEPLSADAARDLVEAFLGAGVLPERLLGAVVAASGGNPLFVEELVRSWIQTGLLHRADDGTWAFTGDAAGAPALPMTVQAIYQGQLDVLPEPVRAVVEHGSVPGTTFPVAALAALGVPDADQPLGELTRVGLLVGPHEHAVGTDSYTYRHALLRDTAYGSLGRHRRAELHARFARWIRALPGPLGTELAGTHLALAHEVLPATRAGLDDGTTVADLAREAASLLADAADAAMVSAPQRAASLLTDALALPAGTGAERL